MVRGRASARRVESNFQVEEESGGEREGSTSDAGSAVGEAPAYVEEQEADSEEESSGSESDDEVIFIGRQSAPTVALHQSLLSQFSRA